MWIFGCEICGFYFLKTGFVSVLFLFVSASILRTPQERGEKMTREGQDKAWICLFFILKMKILQLTNHCSDLAKFE